MSPCTLALYLIFQEILGPIANFLRFVAYGLYRLGPFGLVILGVLDSSFLTMPLGNDLLVIALSAAHHSRMPLYAGIAATSSVIGCLLVDLVSRKAGSKLERFFSKKRLDYVAEKVDKQAGWAIAIASLMPPPFPFTPFVAGSAAFGYPRKKLLVIIGVTRLARFSAEGMLAIFYGERILAFGKSHVFEYGIFALIVISFGASGLSIYRWIRSSRNT